MSSSRMPAWVVGAQAAGALAAVGSVGSLTGLAPVWGAGTACVVAACLLLVEVARPGGAVPGRVMIQIARAGGLGAWLVWCLWPGTAPLGIVPLGVLTAGCMVGAHLSLLQPTRKQPGTGLVLRASSEWEKRIRDVGGMRWSTVQVDVKKWANGSGERVRVQIPPGGLTADDLRRMIPALAADADLPRGCGIDMADVDDAGRRTVDLQVTTTSRLDENIPYPNTYEPRSILDLAPIGEHADGTLAEAPLREESWLVVGKTGSGKTTLLHGLTATVGLCADALVWHIDLNGGSLSQPWVQPWLEGKTERCAIDWAAPTVDEAVRMMEAAVRIAKHRKVAYRSLKRRHNVSLLPVSGELPAIEIILDEGAEALAAAGKGQAARLAALLDEVQRIARDAAVREIMSVLRGTSDLIPAGMTAQTGVAICMKVEKEKELAAVFEWGSGVDHRDLRRRGAGFLRDQDGDIRQFQSWNILPAQVEEVAGVIGRQRPELDEASAGAAGEDYASRWGRVRALFSDEGALTAPPTAEPEPAPASSVSGAGAWPDPADIGRTHTARPALPAGQEDGRVFHTSMAATRDLLADVIAVFDEHQVDRVTREQLAQWVTGGDEVLLRSRMREAGICPPRPIRIDGTYERGWMRSDVQKAKDVTRV